MDLGQFGIGITAPPEIAQPGQRPRSERMRFVGDLLSNFTFALARGLEAQSRIPGPRGNMAGVGASFAAPFELQAFRQQQQLAQQKAALEQQQQQRLMQMLGLQQQEEQRRAKEAALGEELVPMEDPAGKPIMVPRKFATAYIQGGFAKERTTQQQAGATERTGMQQAGAGERLQASLKAAAEQQGLTRENQMNIAKLPFLQPKAPQAPMLPERFQQELDLRKASGGNRVSAPVGFEELDPKQQNRITQIAEKIANGEISYQAGLSTLGGVRSGLGAALVDALSDKRVVPPKVREEYTNIQRARNLLVPIRALIKEINAAPNVATKLEKSYQIENYVQSIGTQFARARGERGVVTNLDVDRVLGLLPGWKSANFAPEFAESNLKLVEETFDRDEKALTDKYFTQFKLGGGGAKTPQQELEEYKKKKGIK